MREVCRVLCQPNQGEVCVYGAGEIAGLSRRERRSGKAGKFLRVWNNF